MGLYIRVMKLLEKYREQGTGTRPINYGRFNKELVLLVVNYLLEGK